MLVYDPSNSDVLSDPDSTGENRAMRVSSSDCARNARSRFGINKDRASVALRLLNIQKLLRKAAAWLRELAATQTYSSDGLLQPQVSGGSSDADTSVEARRFHISRLRLTNIAGGAGPRAKRPFWTRQPSVRVGRKPPGFVLERQLRRRYRGARRDKPAESRRHPSFLYSQS